MSSVHAPSGEVFSQREVARAAGVPLSTVRDAVRTARIATVDGFLSEREAVRCLRAVRTPGLVRGDDMFATELGTARLPPGGLAASGLLHAVGFVLALFLATLELTSADTDQRVMDAPRLVFIPTPGPGGGGGGGGLRQPAPPPKAELKGVERLKSPVPPPRRTPLKRPDPVARPKPVVPTLAPTPPVAPPPSPAPVVTPQVVAPVVTASADPKDRAGVLSESAATAESQGSGSGGGVGTGRGTGIGEGEGVGIGPGSGGGTGGGPYRGGSGISSPGLLHEVRPDYTEDGRRQGIEGDVILEIVVRRDGSVGDVKVLQGLGGGLEARAVQAVRQWRFSPARRHGTPVDVIVEVAVEFKLR